MVGKAAGRTSEEFQDTWTLEDVGTVQHPTLSGCLIDPNWLVVVGCSVFFFCHRASWSGRRGLTWVGSVELRGVRCDGMSQEMAL